ncbi:hypothetical protein [Leptolyngbya sp. FACHB-261]|uniref:hypothetical protein n=1 Tax=Leptolyngbya sp. FACHB-261 TaxID=2692806 RepID=UPI0016841622|nr:hypothetical protein [Leptolyngbya sp. FACHB-261]MBD2101063.1 hypothetical protein [Leptolyngbya sp. FACHB-261]
MLQEIKITGYWLLAHSLSCALLSQPVLAQTSLSVQLGALVSPPSLRLAAQTPSANTLPPPLPAPTRPIELEFRRPERSTEAGQYLVYVPAASGALLSRVRTLVPDAFATQLGGRSVVQAGRFAQENNARSLVQALAQAGVSAQVIRLAQLGITAGSAQTSGQIPGQIPGQAPESPSSSSEAPEAASGSATPGVPPLASASEASRICPQGLVINGSPGQMIQVVVLPAGSGEPIVRQFTLGPQSALRC